ncbi:hypothetical protein GBAR_LOCUS28871 [Geodia barretti]|uniref:Uncharacterized protein n=1 Tax=Geodia barretti TaxID=519541 RepID=A0AA35XCU4_GEOBA|nr:hypothetical protein GBAR_LOCUS28871 [Geodia barretti]
MSPCSIPIPQQLSMSQLTQSTSTTTTVTDPITTATVVMDTTNFLNRHRNQDDVVFPGNSNSNRSSPYGFLGTMATPDSRVGESDFSTGRQSRLSRDGECVVPSGDVLEEGVRAQPRCRSVGWGTTEWMGESGGITPRSDSSLSLRSCSSSDSSVMGDTVIQCGSSTVVVVSTSGKKSPNPDHTQVKLFVKYMPHCCSPEKAVSLFLVYGKVHLLEYHSEHRDKLFLIMDREGGLQAMSGLNGTRLPGSPKPLSVQLYRSVPVSTTPIVQRADSITADKTLRVRMCTVFYIGSLKKTVTNQSFGNCYGAYMYLVYSFIYCPDTHELKVFKAEKNLLQATVETGQLYYVCMVNTSTVCIYSQGNLTHSFFSLSCLSRTSNQTRRRKRFLSCFPSTDECLTCKKHPNRRSVAFVVSAP